MVKRKSNRKIVPPVPVRTAARDVYDIVELRLKIFKELPRSDLVNLLRVEKEGLLEVAKILYHTMPYLAVDDIIKGTRPGKRYLEAISVIDAHTMYISRSQYEKLDIRKVWRDQGNSRKVQEEYFRSELNTEILDIILPTLQAQCPNLRRVLFGLDYYCVNPDVGGHWIVHLPIGVVSVDNPIHIDRYGNDMEGIMGPPHPGAGRWSAKEIIRNYHIRLRWNMQLERPEEETPATLEAWLRDIKANPRYTNLHKFIALNFPVSLDDLMDVCKVQPERNLERIHAPIILSFNIADFERFAKIAFDFSSLSVLRLAYGHQPKTSLTFHDLPSMISIIQKYLPKLEELYLSVNGVEEAEAFFAPLIVSNPPNLTDRGSIRALRIFTAPHSIDLPNTIRYLSGIFAPIFDIDIGPHHDNEDECSSGKIFSNGEQISFLYWIREQAEKGRSYLSHFDFQQLGLTSLTDITDLQFNEENYPVKRPDLTEEEADADFRTRRFEMLTKVLMYKASRFKCPSESERIKLVSEAESLVKAA